MLINIYVRPTDTAEEANEEVVHGLPTPQNLGFILGQLIAPETIITLECLNEGMEEARRRPVS